MAKYNSIGLPSTHVIEILPVMDAISNKLGIKVAYPDYVKRAGDQTWEPNFEIYRKPIDRPFPKLCWKTNMIYLEAQRMKKEEGVEALLIPRLQTDRFKPCVGANGLISLIKRNFSDTPIMTPLFYDDREPTLTSIEGLVRELGGAEGDVKQVLESVQKVAAFEVSLERNAEKFVASKDFPTVGVISHFREVAMLNRLSHRFSVNFVPLRELADEKRIPSFLVKPNPTFFQTNDVIARANQLFDQGHMIGLAMLMDEFCVPRKTVEPELFKGVKAPVTVLRLNEFDYLKIIEEGRLNYGHEEQLTHLISEGQRLVKVNQEGRANSRIEK